jgi:3-deoxy-D-manno-octulosonic-acid transferase
LFASFAGVGCQNEGDAQKLIKLGCKPSVVHVVGNMKYDAARLSERRVVDVPRLLQQLGVPPDAPLLVAGSTHRGEEGILAGIFARLRARFPNLFLVIVPRHHERGREAGRDIAAQGVPFVYRTEITPARQHKPGEVQCLLVNTTGELKCFYEFARVVFVGKTLTAKGGQNPIEPAMLGKPVIFGPNMQNFEAIASALISQRGALQVASADELEKGVAKLLLDEQQATELGRNGQRVVKENLGSVERTVDMILEELDDEDIYIVAPN